MKKAFTLIELLVVVSIIGVLTAIVLTQFNVVKARARDAKRISDISQMQLIVQQYFDRCNQYPSATGTGSNAGLNISSSVGCPAGVTLGTFLTQLPTPPVEVSDNANPYTYRYMVHTTSGINDDYYIVARLEQWNKALDDDLDGTIPATTAGWTGWAIGNNFATMIVNDDRTSGTYMYAVRSK